MADLWDHLSEPFQPAFMARGLLVVLLLAIPAGVLGAWIVMRRLAFMSHALGHATFPAVVIAYIAGWSVFGVAFAAAVVLALGLGWLSRRPGLADGVAVGIVLSAALALGAVLVSDVVDPGVGARTVLFGSLLAVAEGDLARAAVVGGVVLAAGVLLARSWTSVAFDRAAARAAGVPAGALDAILLVLLAAAVSISVDVVGSLLVSGIFLVPAATARLVTRRTTTLQVAAGALAAVEGTVGLWIAYRADAPPGACIAAVAAGGFVAVALARGAVNAVARRPAFGRAAG